MKKLIYILAAFIFLTTNVKAQETPPAGLHSVNGQFYINLVDSSIWQNKGAPYGWHRAGKFKGSLLKADSSDYTTTWQLRHGSNNSTGAWDFAHLATFDNGVTLHNTSNIGTNANLRFTDYHGVRSNAFVLWNYDGAFAISDVANQVGINIDSTATGGQLRDYDNVPYLKLPISVDSTKNYRFDGYKAFATDTVNQNSGFARIDANTILMAWVHGGVLSEIDNSEGIWGAISTDNGVTYGSRFLIYKDAYADINLSVGNSANGSIIIAFRRYDNVGATTIGVGFVKSADGVTWSGLNSISLTSAAIAPHGNVFVRGTKTYFVLYTNFVTSVTNAIGTLYESANNGTDNFNTSYTLYNEATKRLSEPYLIDLPNGKSIILARNEVGTATTTSTWQVNSTDGFTFGTPTATNINSDLNFSQRSPVLPVIDGGNLIVFAQRRGGSTTPTNNNLYNGMNIYIQPYATAYASPTGYLLRANIQRPTPTNTYSFMGYPSVIKTTTGHFKLSITDRYREDNTVATIATNQHFSLYFFDFDRLTITSLDASKYPNTVVTKNTYNGGQDYVFTNAVDKVASFNTMTAPGDFNTGGTNGVPTRLAANTGSTLVLSETTSVPAWITALASFGTVNANTFIAGPVSGSAAIPTARVINTKDTQPIFGANVITGTLDANNVVNMQPGFGPTLLRGTTATNMPVTNAAFLHVFNIEFGTAKNGTAQVTQLYIPYVDATSQKAGMFIRGVNAGTPTAYYHFVTETGLGTTSNAIPISNGDGTYTSGVPGGDLTISGPTFTIGANKVTYAKMQTVTTNKLLGSGSGTAVAEITPGTGLSFSGTTLNASIINRSHTIFTPTTGGTVTLVNNQYNIINPAGALLALTVNLPASPVNNDIVTIKFTQAVTTVTYSGGTVADGITSPVAGGFITYTYDSGASTWY